ncbi:Spy/CpxP family protein refolding chaperone (plasmid) [Methylocapsa polymorpha]|uniref:Spy/CpxP family protein refolding chaperone n=1 Tax=Methylocapsa polymorpha TaxID=3080828 RepID=A0ABZ0HYW4_9HYPH|nr:Spy/CpxP family protein refolding chaperone [Methylocapsa sp. RX1]WOJ91609.1 Spy/CpxP family protein refolding chaperone [Methylocapsa sp. RX1]
MKKHFFIATTVALLALPNLFSSVLAAPPEPSERAGAHHPRFSAEDFAAFTDAHIAALKAGLKLTPAQEKNWPALETTLREQAKAHAALAAEWRDGVEEPHERSGEPRERTEERRDVIEGLRQRAKHLTARSTELAARSTELEKLAEAAKPLYDSLNDAQKRRLRPLLHTAAGGPWHHAHEGFHPSEDFDGHEDAEHGDQ